MRPWLLLPAVVLCVPPPAALAQAGGAAAPTEAGGAEYGMPGAKPRRSAGERTRPSARALVATHFTATPGTVARTGAPVRFAYRIDGAARRVRVRIDLVAEGAPAPAARIRLGWKAIGVRRVHRWTPPRSLPDGRYEARLHAVDDRGRKLARNAAASGRSFLRLAPAPVPVHVGSGVFPLQGPWSYAGDDGRFGAQRGDRLHQGQDLLAAEGTPVVSPRAGFVFWRAHQAGGAGHYVVIRGDDGRDYAFMHLRGGSITVERDAAVTAGQRIGEVGSTGRSSGPHLHFEIWPGGWLAKDSEPIDPRPDLDAWAAGTAPAAGAPAG